MIGIAKHFEVDDFVEILARENAGELGVVSKIEAGPKPYAVRNMAGHRGWFDSTELRHVEETLRREAELHGAEQEKGK